VRAGENRSAALIVSDEEAPPQPDQVKGLTFFGNTGEDAMQLAVGYLGMQVGRE